MDVLAFIFDNKELFVYSLLLVLAVIQLLILLFKKKILNVEGIQDFILRKLPSLIIKAEAIYGAGSGHEKLLFVHDQIISLICNEYGLTSNYIITNYDKFIRYHIEEILLTPQSKEGE